MTDAELATIMAALHQSKRELDRGPVGETERVAITSLGIAVELLADIVYRMSKR